MVVAVLVVALDGCVLDGSVHPFDLSVRPGMVGLGEAVIDTVGAADAIKGMPPKASGESLALLGQVGEPRFAGQSRAEIYGWGCSGCWGSRSILGKGGGRRGCCGPTRRR